MEALYIPIPFCARRCVYCSFYTEALGRGTQRDPRIGRFLAALDLELSRLPRPCAPRTVFMGGGTPNALDAGELGRLFDSVRRHVDLGRVVEWTAEANPGLLDDARVEALRAGGVNRVSLGTQSFQPHLLAFLTRDHGPEAVADAARALLQEVAGR
jgi:oxygen-independent coproporphyrinogen-3 oxidase